MGSITSQKFVRETIAANYPTSPADLISVEDVIPNPEHRDMSKTTISIKSPIPPDSPSFHPPYLGIRLHALLTDHEQVHILKKFHQMVAAGAQHLLKKKDQRSSTPAYHLGIWEVTQPKPLITQETCRQSQHATNAIRRFLRAVQKHIAPKLSALQFTIARPLWARQQR